MVAQRDASAALGLLGVVAAVLGPAPAAGFVVPLSMAASMPAGDFSPRVQGLDFLDDTGGLWQLTKTLVPLPHQRLHLCSAIEAAKLDRSAGAGGAASAGTTVTAHEAHATFLPLRQALRDMHGQAAQEQRRCVVGIGGPPGAGSADFARLLAAVAAHTEEGHGGGRCEWAQGVECAVIGTEGYLRESDAAEPLAGPDAYDCARLVADLTQLREHADRDVSVASADAVRASQGVVIVHGPHVLQREGAWAGLDGLFDLTLSLQLSDDDATGSQDGQDSFGRPYVPAEVSARVLAARIQLSQWQDQAPADVNLAFQTSGPGQPLFVPETLSIAPQLRRRASILAVGLNPSYQKSLQMGELKVGDVNRGERLTISVGGKGQHLALAANRLCRGSSSVAHFLGKKGEEGNAMFESLKEMGMEQEVQWHQGVTRTCTTLLEESGRMTEIIEPSDAIPKPDVDAFIPRILSKGKECAGVALCGTFPPGVSEEVYAELASSVGPDTILLLDGFKGVEKTLATKRVNVLKINADELCWLTEEKDLDKAARIAMETHLAPGALLAVTRGPSSALLYSSSGGGSQDGSAPISVTEFEITPVKALNPIGAGDTCSSVLLYALCAGNSAEDAFASALAAASASCLNIRGAHFKAADAASLHAAIKRLPARTLAP